MKKTLLFCLLVLFVATASTQIVADRDTLRVIMHKDTLEKVAYNFVTNKSNSQKTFRWTRQEIFVSSNCVSFVCDPVACFLPSVSTRTFTLQAQAKGNLDMHLRNNQLGTECCAIIRLRVEETTDPANVVHIMHYFNTCTISTDDHHQVFNLKIYPNPVQTHFQLEDATHAALLRVFSRDGREVKRFDSMLPQFDISELPSSTYFVLIYDQHGRALQAIEIVKN